MGEPKTNWIGSPSFVTCKLWSLKLCTSGLGEATSRIRNLWRCFQQFSQRRQQQTTCTRERARVYLLTYVNRSRAAHQSTATGACCASLSFVLRFSWIFTFFTLKTFRRKTPVLRASESYFTRTRILITSYFTLTPKTTLPHVNRWRCSTTYRTCTRSLEPSWSPWVRSASACANSSKWQRKRSDHSFICEEREPSEEAAVTCMRR